MDRFTLQSYCPPTPAILSTLPPPHSIIPPRNPSCQRCSAALGSADVHTCPRALWLHRRAPLLGKVPWRGGSPRESRWLPSLLGSSSLCKIGAMKSCFALLCFYYLLNPPNSMKLDRPYFLQSQKDPGTQLGGQCIALRLSEF